MTDPQASPLPTPEPKPTPMRLWVLLALLIVMIGGAVYDYQVARPAVDDAYDALLEISREEGKVMRESDVQAALGRKPSLSFTESKDKVRVDEYRWVSGLLYKSYHVFVVYNATVDDPVVLRIEKNNHELLPYLGQEPSGPPPPTPPATTDPIEPAPDEAPAQPN